MYRVRRPGGIGYAVAGFSRDCLYRLIDFPELPLRTTARETIKAGDGTLLVRAEFPVGGSMRAVAYKRAERRGWLKRLTALFRANLTLRAWRLGHHLLRRGVTTARPLAVVVPRRWDMTRPTFSAAEWLEGAATLDAFHREASALPAPDRDRALAAAAECLARLLGTMHARRISHRDLKGANLLLRPRGASVEAFVIDLDGAATHWRLSGCRRRSNLARFALGVAHLPYLRRSLRLRFLKQYLCTHSGSDAGWRAAWRALERRTAALAARKSRRYRRQEQRRPR